MKHLLIHSYLICIGIICSNSAFANERPVLSAGHAFDRDYSFLSDPAKRTEPLDRIKYISLGSNPSSYLSFGGEFRERYEGFIRNPLFGITGLNSDEYFLHRALLHADLHVNENFRAFVQLGHHRVWGKDGAVTPTEEDKGDIQQAFVETHFLASDKDRVTLRAGRQEMYFGSQRLVSVREGPNIRQSFDAIRAIYEHEKSNISAFASHAVEIDRGSFDDNSDDSQRFWGIYGVAPILYGLNADLYYLGLEREHARFAEGTGNEKRHSIGSRLWGEQGSVDYNFELVYQFGEFGQGDISAWTVASDTGYTFKGVTWQPRVALRADVASGDKKQGDRDLNTFNALFPKGSYFTENALIGPANFIDIHPYVTVKPMKSLSVTAGSDFLWRQDTSDAIFRQPNIPIAGTAGNRSRYTGTQPYLFATYQVDPHTSVSATYVHFEAGEAIKDAGGNDSEYVGGWLTYRF